jgi:hypothetical protein
MSGGRQRRRQIDRLVDRLVESRDWDRSQALLDRYPELEWGRARVLSDVLDRARLRLLAISYPAAADRYWQAAARLDAREQERPSSSYDMLALSGGGST